MWRGLLFFGGGGALLAKTTNLKIGRLTLGLGAREGRTADLKGGDLSYTHSLVAFAFCVLPCSSCSATLDPS